MRSHDVVRVVLENPGRAEWYAGPRKIVNPGDPPRLWRLTDQLFRERSSIGHGLLWWPETIDEAEGLLRSSHALGLAFDDRRYWDPFPFGWVWLRYDNRAECPFQASDPDWRGASGVMGDALPQDGYRFRERCVDANLPYNGAPRTVLLRKEWIDSLVSRLGAVLSTMTRTVLPTVAENQSCRIRAGGRR